MSRKGNLPLLDQIVFRWDSRNATGNGGYGPTAYSCDPQDALEIYEEIRTALRPDGTQRRASLGRLSLSNGRALAFKRVPGSDSAGRSAPVCHGLVGDGALLPPTDCLALRGWRWPSERVPTDWSGRVLDAIEAYEVVEEANDAHLPLVGELRDRPAQLDLTALVAATLEHPRSRLLVLAQGLAASPAALAYGLAELFGEFWSGGWNFSTYETRDGGDYQLAFAPAWPETATQAADLVRVDLHSLDGDQWIVPVARQVVALYTDRDRKCRSVLEKAAEGTDFPDAEALEHILGQRVHARRKPSGSSGTAATVKRAAPPPAPSASVSVTDSSIGHLHAPATPMLPAEAVSNPAASAPTEPRARAP